MDPLIDRVVTMAAASGIAGLFRSVASKLARAPPPQRCLTALGTRGGFPGCSSRPFGSSPAGSKFNNKDGTGKLDSTSDPAIVKLSYFMVFGGSIYMWWWFLPALDRINHNLDAAEQARLKRQEETIQRIKDEFQMFHESQETYAQERTTYTSGFWK